MADFISALFSIYFILSVLYINIKYLPKVDTAHIQYFKFCDAVVHPISDISPEKWRQYRFVCVYEGLGGGCRNNSLKIAE